MPTTLRANQLTGWLLGAGVLLAGPALAQHLTPPGGVHSATPPPYQVERAREDYRYMASDTSRVAPDLFDPLKFISLNPARTAYLSLGGEIRPQYQWIINHNWGAGPDDPSGYLLTRYMVHADLHLGPHVRVFGQLKSGLTYFKTYPPDLPDEDQLDVHQAFVDVGTAPGRTGLTLRIGRQEMNYGAGRLISLREGPNVRLSFDGVRVLSYAPGWKLDGFLTRPTTTEPGIFDDKPDATVSFWGLYGVRTLRKLGGGLDFYYLGFANQAARFQQGLAAERRYSAGSRWWGTRGAFSYNLEAVYQWGHFGSGNIRAWTASSEAGYRLAGLPLRPLGQFRVEYISGDQGGDDARLQTFNPLFPKGSYFGQAALIGPANLFDLHPVLALYPLPTDAFTLLLDWDFFWRASGSDGVYATPYVLNRPGSPAQARYVGDQLTLEGDYYAGRHWEFEFFLTWFRAGPFLKQSGPGLDQTYLSPRVTFRF